MTDSTSWYDTGFDAVDKLPEHNATRDNRFWLRPGASAQVIFVDGDEKDEPFVLWEHNLQIDGRWGNYITCTAGTSGSKGCAVCDHLRGVQGAQRAYIGVLTVINVTGWKTKDGKEVNNVPQLLVAKRKNIKQLRRARQLRDGLRGQLWEPFRAEKTDARIGDSWQFVKTLDDFEDTYGVNAGDNMVVPFNYKEAFKPFTYDQVYEIIKPIIPRTVRAQDSSGPAGPAAGAKSISY